MIEIKLSRTPSGTASRGGTRLRSVLGAALLMGGLGAVTLATVLDDFGPPPAGDPSAFTGPLIGVQWAIDFLATLDHANGGAFEGGATGTAEDAGLNNVFGEDDLNSNKVPTGGPPSPLFGAGEFEQQLLLFEEFGSERLANAPAPTIPFPPPAIGPAPEQDPFQVAASGPAPAALEAFLGQAGISPFPTEFANVTAANPWAPQIGTFLGRALVTPPAEGRPPGKGWASPSVTTSWSTSPPRASRPATSSISSTCWSTRTAR